MHLILLSTVHLVAACGWTQVSGQRARQDPPPALLAFEQARREIVAGRAEWTALPGGDAGAALSFVSRFARNGDLIFENRGDSDGWTIFNAETGEGFSKYPQLYLVNQRGSWQFQETGLNCRWWKQDAEASSRARNMLARVQRNIRDIRALGVSPWSSSLEYANGIDSLWGSKEDPVERWTQREFDGFYVVRGHHRSGGTRTWYINSARGWNAERVVYEAGGSTWEVVCSLVESGDVWFPEEARYYQDGRLVDAVMVSLAEWDTAGGPKEFTPADLGVEPGSLIAVQNAPGKSGSHAPTWNGEEIVTFHAWLKDVQSKRRQWGPMHRKAQKVGYLESPYDTPEQLTARKLRRRSMVIRSVLKRHEGLWERYVREFIRRHELNDEQEARAWMVLGDCRSRAESLMERRRATLVRTASELLKAEQENDPRRVETYTGKLRELRKPIEGIFESGLKPRLEKLLTRAQRQVAEELQAKKKEP